MQGENSHFSRPHKEFKFKCIRTGLGWGVLGFSDKHAGGTPVGSKPKWNPAAGGDYQIDK